MSIEILSHDHAMGEKINNNLKFGTFIGCFGFDGMASIAVKGLIITLLTGTYVSSVAL